MRRCAVMIFWLLVGLWGCVHPSPLPPLAIEPIPGESSTYDFTLFRWKPGMRVVTRTTMLGEARVKDKTEHLSGTSITTATAEQVTARGFVHVQILEDGKPGGSAFYDESGGLADTSFAATDQPPDDINGCVEGD
jgi:hypothetical protein